jgi:hypothetical protein
MKTISKYKINNLVNGNSQSYQANDVQEEYLQLLVLDVCTWSFTRSAVEERTCSSTNASNPSKVT